MATTSCPYNAEKTLKRKRKKYLRIDTKLALGGRYNRVSYFDAILIKLPGQDKIVTDLVREQIISEFHCAVYRHSQSVKSCI